MSTILRNLIAIVSLISIISVDTCLKMCGLEPFRDAIVGSLGVEHRKRTTIGVELAAKVGSVMILSACAAHTRISAQTTPLPRRAYQRIGFSVGLECLGLPKKPR